MVGSKRVFKIDVTGRNRRHRRRPADRGPAGRIIPVAKSDLFIDLAANSLLPNGKLAEKWEGLAIGPRLRHGGRLILTGNDNDYSVTQTGSGEQFDVYVDFQGHFARCVIDNPALCEVDPPAADQVIDNPVPAPPGFSLLPGLLHVYRASAADVEGYVAPGRNRSGHDDRDHDCDRDDDRGDGRHDDDHGDRDGWFDRDRSRR